MWPPRILILFPAHCIIANYLFFWNKTVFWWTFWHGRESQWPTSVADPGFSPGGCANPQNCYYFSNFGRKLHENERIWTRGGGQASLAHPLGSANELHQLYFTSHQQSCGKLMFSVVNVCHSVYGGQGVPQWMWPLPLMPLVSHRSCGDPSWLKPSSPCPYHTSLTPWPIPSPSLSSSPDMFKFVQFGPHCTRALSQNMFKLVHYVVCLQAGSLHSTEMPSCYTLQFFLLVSKPEWHLLLYMFCRA